MQSLKSPYILYNQQSVGSTLHNNLLFITYAALLVRHRDHFAIRHMGFLLYIDLATCGGADGYVRGWKKPSAFLQMA